MSERRSRAAQAERAAATPQARFLGEGVTRSPSRRHAAQPAAGMPTQAAIEVGTGGNGR